MELRRPLVARNLPQIIIRIVNGQHTSVRTGAIRGDDIRDALGLPINTATRIVWGVLLVIGNVSVCGRCLSYYRGGYVMDNCRIRIEL